MVRLGDTIKIGIDFREDNATGDHYVSLGPTCVSYFSSCQSGHPVSNCTHRHWGFKQGNERTRGEAGVEDATLSVSLSAPSAGSGERAEPFAGAFGVAGVTGDWIA